MTRDEFIDCFAHFITESDLNAAFPAHFEELGRMNYDKVREWLRKIIDEPIIHAHWIDNCCCMHNGKEVPVVRCSNCGISFCDLVNNHRAVYHCCPQCGARMDEEVEE